MTIDEAIEHERRVAREHRYGEKDHAYHMQLAEWLRKARGAEKAARWYTKKIEELENRDNALERLLGESEEENERLLNRMRGEDKEILSEGEPSYCPYCGGSILYTEARFCPHCGRSLITE
jgi:predicted  nucleic acid-binding Zn-ribbon protein